MSKIVVEMTAKEARLLAALRGAEKGLDGVAKGNSKVNEEARQAALAESRLVREAKRLGSEAAPAQEKYNSKVAKLRELLKANKITQQEYNAAVAHARNQLDGTARSGRRAFGPGAVSMARNFATALGLGGGVAGVVMTLRKEFEALWEAQQRMKETTTTVADQQIEYLRNAGFQTAAARDAATKRLEGISRVTGVEMKDLYARASTSTSAKGALSEEASMRAVEASALLVPEDAAKGTAVAGAALDLAKITGTTDAKANIGLLMAIAGKARVTEIGKVAENVAPALTSVMMQGDTESEAGALWATITGGSADATGRKSKTASIGLAKQLAEFLPTETTYTYDKKGKRVVDAKGSGLTSTRQRIEAIQQNPRLYEKFMANASFEKAQSGVIEQILQGKGSGASTYASFLQSMPSVAEGRAIFDKNVGVIRGAEEQKTAALARSLETTAERLELADQGGARAGATREQINRILTDTGLGWVATKFKSAGAESSPDYLKSFRNTIAERRQQLVAPTEQKMVGGLSMAPGAKTLQIETVARQVTQLEKDQAAILGELEAFLGEMIAEQKATNGLLTEGNAERSNQKPATGADPQEDR